MLARCSHSRRTSRITPPRDSCEIIKGGTGYDIKSALKCEIDAMTPDYSMYPRCDYAIGFLTRGCIRKCPWCVVPEKEGKIREYRTIEEVMRNDTRKIILMDNNFLAADSGFVREQLEKSIEYGLSIDFNQALDERLVNDENARLLAKCRWTRFIRFSCDTDEQKEPLEHAVRKIRENGYKGEFMVYILAKDVENALERVKFAESLGFTPFVMPFKDITNGKFGKDAGDDVKRLARWCNIQSIRHSCSFSDYGKSMGTGIRELF